MPALLSTWKLSFQVKTYPRRAELSVISLEHFVMGARTYASPFRLLAKCGCGFKNCPQAKQFACFTQYLYGHGYFVFRRTQNSVTLTESVHLLDFLFVFDSKKPQKALRNAPSISHPARGFRCCENNAPPVTSVRKSKAVCFFYLVTPRGIEPRFNA